MKRGDTEAEEDTGGILDVIVVKPRVPGGGTAQQPEEGRGKTGQEDREANGRLVAQGATVQWPVFMELDPDSYSPPMSPLSPEPSGLEDYIPTFAPVKPWADVNATALAPTEVHVEFLEIAISQPAPLHAEEQEEEGSSPMSPLSPLPPSPSPPPPVHAVSPSPTSPPRKPRQTKSRSTSREDHQTNTSPSAGTRSRTGCMWLGSGRGGAASSPTPEALGVGVSPESTASEAALYKDAAQLRKTGAPCPRVPEWYGMVEKVGTVAMFEQGVERMRWRAEFGEPIIRDPQPARGRHEEGLGEAGLAGVRGWSNLLSGKEGDNTGRVGAEGVSAEGVDAEGVSAEAVVAEGVGAEGVGAEGGVDAGGVKVEGVDAQEGREIGQELPWGMSIEADLIIDLTDDGEDNSIQASEDPTDPQQEVSYEGPPPESEYGHTLSGRRLRYREMISEEKELEQGNPHAELTRLNTQENKRQSCRLEDSHTHVPPVLQEGEGEGEVEWEGQGELSVASERRVRWADEVDRGGERRVRWADEVEYIVPYDDEVEKVRDTRSRAGGCRGGGESSGTQPPAQPARLSTTLKSSHYNTPLLLPGKETIPATETPASRQGQRDTPTDMHPSTRELIDQIMLGDIGTIRNIAAEDLQYKNTRRHDMRREAVDNNHQSAAGVEGVNGDRRSQGWGNEFVVVRMGRLGAINEERAWDSNQSQEAPSRGSGVVGVSPMVSEVEGGGGDYQNGEEGNGNGSEEYIYGYDQARGWGSDLNIGKSANARCNNEEEEEELSREAPGGGTPRVKRKHQSSDYDNGDDLEGDMHPPRVKRACTLEKMNNNLQNEQSQENRSQGERSLKRAGEGGVPTGSRSAIRNGTSEVEVAGVVNPSGAGGGVGQPGEVEKDAPGGERKRRLELDEEENMVGRARERRGSEGRRRLLPSLCLDWSAAGGQECAGTVKRRKVEVEAQSVERAVGGSSMPQRSRPPSEEDEGERGGVPEWITKIRKVPRHITTTSPGAVLGRQAATAAVHESLQRQVGIHVNAASSSSSAASGDSPGVSNSHGTKLNEGSHVGGDEGSPDSRT